MDKKNVTSGGVSSSESEKLRLAHTHDVPTGLLNRAGFLENVQQWMHHARLREDDFGRFSVLVLKIDKLKTINDSLGYPAGDELIGAIARRLENCVDSPETVARLGADDFAILLKELPDEGEAARIAARIIMELGAPVQINEFPVQNSVSVGIAFVNPHYEQPEELLCDADSAMHRAENDGGNRYHIFDGEMRKSAMGELKFERDLRQAVARQEFVMHYQPIYSVATRKLVSFEALIRWEHPEHGQLPPAEFIPQAEETGLIVPMGWWIIDQAAKACTAWNKHRAGESRLSVNINVSPKQLSQENLGSQINSLLSNAGLEPTDVIFEITENLQMDDFANLPEVLRNLRQRGMRFGLDDFGMGYSSLSFLRQSSLDFIKIDRSFIREIGRPGKSREIVSAILKLARGLDLKMTAEGVETQEQFDAIREMQCDWAQGYFFSKPVPFDEALEIIRRDSHRSARSLS